MCEDRWAVVGFDRDSAEHLFSKIEAECGKTVSRRIQSKYELRTEFTDGTMLTWVRAADSIRGYKFGKMWCDKNINEEILRRIVFSCYFGERKDIIWL